MSARSYYDVLEVEETASDSEIKRAYRRLAMLYHPDKNPDGADLFKEISHAYDTLSDPDRRAAYDQFGMGGDPSGGFGGFDGFGMDDGFFDEHMFGGHGPPPPPRAEAHPLPVTLADLFHGKRVRVRLVRSVVCKRCNGAGGKRSVLRECLACGGKGTRIAARQVAPGLFSQARVQCTACRGSGKVVPESDRCRKCTGAGTVDEKAAVEIDIKPGMGDGQRITLYGQGDQPPGQAPQDLVFVLRQEAHSGFQRNGDNLSVHAKIDLAEALCGFSRVLLTHIDGRQIVVSHQSGVLRPGDVLRVSGEGMPQEKRPKARGDLFVVLDILFPDSSWRPDPALRALLPRTAQDAAPAHQGSPATEVVGRRISPETYEKEVPKRPQHAHGGAEGGFGRDPRFHQGAQPACEQQ
ncbi:DnaJ-like protein xdj1 [Coemansia nantahalensis]|uniref:DnaJ-like protein xdj1 n=1 Tax=Coemansia nantahalensis TaxID=2789366 RepID=A0ACC1K0F8_9FUNG|nr:DnaJ-like protein xdj1 [Coemansia nantahalensis]